MSKSGKNIPACDFRFCYNSVLTSFFKILLVDATYFVSFRLFSRFFQHKIVCMVAAFRA